MHGLVVTLRVTFSCWYNKVTETNLFSELFFRSWETYWRSERICTWCNYSQYDWRLLEICFAFGVTRFYFGREGQEVTSWLVYSVLFPINPFCLNYMHCNLLYKTCRVRTRYLKPLRKDKVLTRWDGIKHGDKTPVHRHEEQLQEREKTDKLSPALNKNDETHIKCTE